MGEIKGGGTPSKSVEGYWQGDIPWVSPKDFDGLELWDAADHVSSEAVQQSAATLVPPETILMVVRSGVLRHRLPVAITRRELAINQDLKAILPADTVLPDYLLSWLVAEESRILARCVKTGTTVQSVSTASLLDCEVLLPPLPEQRKIAAILSSVDDAIAATRKVFKQTERVKQGLLQDLMTRGVGHTRFKQTEIGEIPQDWEVLRLTDVARLESGHTPARNRDDYWNGRIPWVSLHDTERLNSREIHETEMTITELGVENSSARVLPEGTVVLSRTATIGKCAILGRRMATSQDFANYVCGPRINNRYLLYRFRWMKPVWESLSAGSTHKTVYMPDFKGLRIPLPSAKEQAIIVGIVDAVEDVLERRSTLICSLRTLKRGLLQDLLTGRVRVQPD